MYLWAHVFYSISKCSVLEEDESMCFSIMLQYFQCCVKFHYDSIQRRIMFWKSLKHSSSEERIFHIHHYTHFCLLILWILHIKHCSVQSPESLCLFLFSSFHLKPILRNTHKFTKKNPQNTSTKSTPKTSSRHLSDSEDETHDDRSLLCVRDKA